MDAIRMIVNPSDSPSSTTFSVKESFWKFRTRFEKHLIILIIILIIFFVTILIVVLLTKSPSKVFDDLKTNEVCLSPECVKAGEQDVLLLIN